MRRVDPWFAIGLFAFFALLFVALFGERIAPYEPIFFTVNRGDLQRPFAPGGADTGGGATTVPVPAARVQSFTVRSYSYCADKPRLGTPPR